MSYIFGGDTGISYEQLQQRRKMAERLRQANSRTPRNAGEGIHAIARALVARGVDKQNTKRAEEMRKQYSGIWDGLMGATGGTMDAGYQTGYSGGGEAVEPTTLNPAQEVASDTMRALGKLQILPGTRAQYSPNDGLNISLDFNASPNGGARGTEVIIPDDASPQVRAAAERYNQMVAEFARSNGIENYPVRGVRTRSENKRGVPNTVHVEPFFNDDMEMQKLIQANPQAFAKIYQDAFGGLDARMIAPHGVGNDRGAASDIFGNETDFGMMMINALRGDGRSQPPAGASSQPTPQPVRTAQAGGIDPSVIQLAQMLSAPDEFMPPGQKAVAQALLQQKIAASQPPKPMTPLQQQQFEMNQIELEGMRNPQPGYEIISPEEAARLNLPEGAWQRSADGKISKIGGGGVTVNNQMGGEPGRYIYGSDAGLPQGWRFDIQTQQAEVIPGGPVERDAAAAEKQSEIAEESKETSTNIVMDEIGIAKELIRGESLSSPATGIIGGLVSNIDQTRAGALKNRLTTIKANIGFDKLQAMRDASPTGGALGQVSEFENKLLQAVFGSLEQSQRAEDIMYNLDRLERIYNRVINEGIPDEEARQLYKEVVMDDYGQQGGDQKKNPYKAMTLEDLTNNPPTNEKEAALWNRRFEELEDE